jgi:outer membrane lipoprotein-sorting protein
MRLLVMTVCTALAAASWTQTRNLPAEPVKQNSATAKAGQAESNKGRRLLELSMSRQPRFNVRAVLVQRLDLAGGLRTVKVEMSRDGKIHQIVVAPLSSQGIEFVDDGSHTKTYFPDDKCVIVQPSPSQESNDVATRMKLVDRNYSVRLTRREQIAGCNAAVVEATPRNRVLETRCYAIDEEKGFLLRLDTCREGGQTTTQFETKMIEFPERFTEATFRLDNPMGVIYKTYSDRCVSPESADELRDELRFRPVVPQNLPYGFVVQELQASTDPKPALAVRITDGLAKATVMEWRAEGATHSRPPAGTKVDHAGKITLLISGDLPDQVKEEILLHFVRAAKSDREATDRLGSLAWCEELDDPSELFFGDIERNGIARFFLATPVSIQI